MNFLLTILLFLYGLNVFSRGMFCLLLVAVIVTIRKKPSFYVLREDILFFFFQICFTIFYCINYDSVSFDFLVLPFLAWYIGRVLSSSPDKFGSMDKYILALGFGTFVYGILNIVKRYQLGYQLISWLNAGRMCADFWAGYDIVQTKEATYFLLSICLLFYVYFVQKKKLLKITYILILIGAMFVTFDIGSRTILVLGLVLFMVQLALYLQRMDKHKLKVLCCLVVVLFVLLIAFEANVGGVKSLYMESNFYSRMSGDSYDSVSGLFDINGRNSRYALFISQMIYYPFGGMELEGLGSAHNTFLDIYRVTGVLPFVLFIWLVVRIVKNCIRWIRGTQLFEKDTIVMVAVFAGLLLQFFIESIEILNPMIFQIFLLISGMIISKAQNQQNQLTEGFIYENRSNNAHQIEQ